MYPNTLAPSGSLSDPGTRAQQVESLKSQIPTCHPLNREQSLFEIPLRLQDDRQIALRISLPPNFPQARPSLAVTHPIRHPWVDPAGGRLAFASLQHWLPEQSTLLAVVAEALSELRGGQMTDQQQRQLGAEPATPGSSADPGTSSPHLQHQQRAQSSVQQQQNFQQTDVPQEFPVLNSMSAEELHRLMVDEQAFIELVQGLEAQAAGCAVQRQLRGSNADLASANLARESEIAELRNQIAIIRSSEYALSKEALDQKLARQQAVVAKLSPEALVAKLAASAEQVDAEADALYSQLEAGGITVDAFQQQHLRLRTLYHGRDIKRQAAEQTLL